MNIRTRRAFALTSAILLSLLLCLCLASCDLWGAEPGKGERETFKTYEKTDGTSEVERDTAAEEITDTEPSEKTETHESEAAWETETETETETERRPDGTLPFVPDRPEALDTDWKAIWFSQFDVKSAFTTLEGNQRTEDDFRAQLSVMLDNVANDGFNTVILQMRPNGDSMYPSALYPPSAYAVGDWGKDFSQAYDPIEVFVTMCRERGLAVHAWINPLRGVTEENMQKIPDEYPIKQWYNDPEKNGRYIVCVDGTYYLNPAEAEVRALIAAGVTEILEKYDVDGIHMDDYFYPTTDAGFDADAYASYTAGGGTAELADWRRANLDALVSELYATVKTHDLRALFGISPVGNIGTVYSTHYADIYNWCQNPGYVDYICPQVYFGLEHQTFDFKTVCNTWSDIVKTDYVSLIVGMTFHKAVNAADGIEDPYAGTGAREWIDNQDVLARSLAYTEELENCVGVTVFCYQHLFDTSTGDPLDKSADEHTAFVEKLATVTWHKKADNEDD